MRQLKAAVLVVALLVLVSTSVRSWATPPENYVVQIERATGLIDPLWMICFSFVIDSPRTLACLAGTNRQFLRLLRRTDSIPVRMVLRRMFEVGLFRLRDDASPHDASEAWLRFANAAQAMFLRVETPSFWSSIALSDVEEIQQLTSAIQPTLTLQPVMASGLDGVNEAFSRITARRFANLRELGQSDLLVLHSNTFSVLSVFLGSQRRHLSADQIEDWQTPSSLVRHVMFHSSGSLMIRARRNQLEQEISAMFATTNRRRIAVGVLTYIIYSPVRVVDGIFILAFGTAPATPRTVEGTRMRRVVTHVQNEGLIGTGARALITGVSASALLIGRPVGALAGVITSPVALHRGTGVGQWVQRGAQTGGGVTHRVVNYVLSVSTGAVLGLARGVSLLISASWFRCARGVTSCFR